MSNELLKSIYMVEKTLDTISDTFNAEFALINKKLDLINESKFFELEQKIEEKFKEQLKDKVVFS
jgi:hypothetical protein